MPPQNTGCQSVPNPTIFRVGAITTAAPKPCGKCQIICEPRKLRRTGFQNETWSQERSESSIILAVAVMKYMILLLWNIHGLPDMQWYANELSNTIATPHETIKMPKSEKKDVCPHMVRGVATGFDSLSHSYWSYCVIVFRQFVPFPLNHDSWGPTTTAHAWCGESLLQCDRFSQLSRIQFLDLRLTIDWLCCTAYFLFRGSYLISDDIYRIPQKSRDGTNRTRYHHKPLNIQIAFNPLEDPLHRV